MRTAYFPVHGISTRVVVEAQWKLFLKPAQNASSNNQSHSTSPFQNPILGPDLRKCIPHSIVAYPLVSTPDDQRGQGVISTQQHRMFQQIWHIRLGKLSSTSPNTVRVKKQVELLLPGAKAFVSVTGKRHSTNTLIKLQLPELIALPPHKHASNSLVMEYWGTGRVWKARLSKHNISRE